jgi:hypothetical protein
MASAYGLGLYYNYVAQWEIGWLKVQEVILSDLTQLRKNQNMKPLVTLHSLGEGFQSQNLGENVCFLWLRKGQLWNQISQVLFGFCSAYIYSDERFFSQLFNGVLGI